MTRFSANLGFLWRELPLEAAVRAAAKAGFAAVECHWPYATDPNDLRAVFDDTGMEMQSLNTVVGHEGEFGLAALVGREAEARAAIDQAVDYAAAVGARHVHLMAGCAVGEVAMGCFIENCHYAAHAAQRVGTGLGILIEPINPHDVPGYFLQDFNQARMVLEAVAAPNLKLMFDCYHAGRMGFDVLPLLQNALPIIGHIQIAAVPDRGAPDHGVVDYPAIFAALDALGYTHPLGAEYHPTDGDTDASLTWMRSHIVTPEWEYG